MRKVCLASIALLFVASITAISPSDVFAYHIHTAVLGSSTQQLIMPPTVEGPGFLLPDSPLYFLDQLKQNIRIALAITPEMKAQVYTSIAGERFAETRFELSKGNLSAAEVALQGVRQNTELAAQSLADAQFRGANTQKTAHDINLSIKQHQQVLDTLSLQATGEFKAEVDVVDAALSDSKDVVENSLSQADLANEVRDDLNRDVTRLALSTSNSAKDLQATLDVLQKEATAAASNNQTARAQALQSVIAQKSDEVKQMTITQQDEATKKANLTYALNAQAAVMAAQIVKSAEDVAKTMQATHQIDTSKN